ncbi:MAG: hypothetical protein PHT80_00030 [Lentisphaeria bacterium]|nr:hypothetical protein [Lentisphaeria bacterium]
MGHNGKHILLIGGTGSMGTYLTPLLLERGFLVDVVALNAPEMEHPNLRGIKADAKDLETLKRLLANRYDGIIDFLDYPSDYRMRYRLFLENTKHYIYLSSYRVYAGTVPLTNENSPRFVDLPGYDELYNPDDYNIYKARNEDLLRASGFDNWTIVRPSIVFSKFSLPLVSLGAYAIWNRAQEGKSTLIPDCAVATPCSCTWSGNIAKMFAGILFNPAAFREAFTFTTDENLPWQAWVEFYRERIGLQTWTVDTETFFNLYWNHSRWAVNQVKYDRLLNRSMDNSKIRKVAGLAKSDLLPLQEALGSELAKLSPSYRFPGGEAVNAAIDRYLADGGRILRKL